MDLFYDYRTNLPLYPEVQAYFREHQPPTLIVWGKNDKIFPADGAYPYKRDLPAGRVPPHRHRPFRTGGQGGRDGAADPRLPRPQGRVVKERDSIAQLILASLVLAACAAALTALARGEEADDSSPIFGVKIPAGYRGWELIAPSHEAGGFNELRGILGNAVAMKAYREGTLPFPDGAILAKLAWKQEPSSASATPTS